MRTSTGPIPPPPVTNQQPDDDHGPGASSTLTEWRQGDILEPGRFTWLASAEAPATADSEAAIARGASGIFALHSNFPGGLAVLTPTCDLYPRPGRDRPFVAVAPLVRLEGEVAEEARLGRRPRYVHLPGASTSNVFADLDRVATIETGVLVSGRRRVGLHTDKERDRFAKAVARKFARFAFPDALAVTLGPWRDRVVRTHGRPRSPEGEVFRHATDLRVSADPSWTAESITVTVFVIMEPGWLPELTPDRELSVADVERLSAATTVELASRLIDPSESAAAKTGVVEALQDGWAQMCGPHKEISSVYFELVGADEMTVAEYWGTQSLDLEFLSQDPRGGSDGR